MTSKNWSVVGSIQAEARRDAADRRRNLARKQARAAAKVPSVEPKLERIGTQDDGPRLGAWYWVKQGDHPDWFACARKIGSNFVELSGPDGSYARIHIENFWDECRLEENPDQHIRLRIAGYQEEAGMLLEEVQALVARLGMNSAVDAPAAGNALMVLNEAPDLKKYEKALVQLKDKQLPALFEKIKEAHEHMATWMKAPSLPAYALLGKTKDEIGDIDSRIFSINLYAGLTETAVQVAKGKPAPADAKLHVMQRRLYMDEESLLGYKTGGMEFKDIKAFDAFMRVPENRDRILPYPRTLVAMRVRRNAKEREDEGHLRTALINFQLAQADTATFLYIRNGAQLWRLDCDMDFGELIFPDPSVFDPKEAKMMRNRWSRPEFMSVHLYEERLAKEQEREKKEKAWRKANPGKDDWVHNPHRNYHVDLDGWKLLDHANVYYDEGMAAIEKQIREYNRVALIIQGLFDRSEVLHPHPPVKSWTAEGFDAAITLVQDGTGVLTYGEPPSFEEYRSSLNETLTVGCITAGQNDAWQAKEAVKENARRQADYRWKGDNYVKRFKPYGNPGPSDPGKVEALGIKGALFKWERERLHPARTSPWGGGSMEDIACSIRVPVEKLLNVSAYQPGDFKQFFRDPRTRARYLEWAPLLLAAEEYVAKHPNPPREKPWFEMFNYKE